MTLLNILETVTMFPIQLSTEAVRCPHCREVMHAVFYGDKTRFECNLCAATVDATELRAAIVATPQALQQQML